MENQCWEKDNEQLEQAKKNAIVEKEKLSFKLSAADIKIKQLESQSEQEKKKKQELKSKLAGVTERATTFQSKYEKLVRVLQ